jgi:spermidine synthase
MSYDFAELDYQQTPLGEISLRRRAEPRLDGKILYEVKLGDEFLMSSLFTEAEEQLSTIGLKMLGDKNLDVVVGGLGLGYTAWAALKYPNVESLIVIDVMKPVIDWHQRELIPLGQELNDDPRCTLIHADFFELATSDCSGFYNNDSKKLAHAILLDIDHSPSHWLNPENESFYSPAGLQSLAEKLHEGGLFGMWSNDPPETEFIQLLEQVFDTVSSEVISFPNPYSGAESSNTIYLARKARC